MAQASRTERKVRRLKNERRLAHNALRVVLRDRDWARFVAVNLEKELEKYAPQTNKLEGMPEIQAPKIEVRKLSRGERIAELVLAGQSEPDATTQVDSEDGVVNE